MTPRGVVVRGDRNLLFVTRDRAGNVVLIKPIVAAKEGAITNVETSGLMLDDSRTEIHARSHAAVVGIAEERFDRHVYRTPMKRRNATIGDAAIVKIFVRKLHCRSWTNVQRRSWI